MLNFCQYPEDIELPGNKIIIWLVHSRLGVIILLIELDFTNIIIFINYD